MRALKGNEVRKELSLRFALLLNHFIHSRFDLQAADDFFQECLIRAIETVLLK